MLAFETEDVLQAWALPMENIIGVGGFVLALAAKPLTSGLGREGSLGCRTSSVPPERLRLSLTERGKPFPFSCGTRHYGAICDRFGR